MKAFSAGERLWLLALLAAAMLLGVKSYWLDPWKPATAEQVLWQQAALAVLNEEADAWSVERGLIRERIVKIRPGVPGKDDGSLQVTVRAYVLGYLPFGDRKITVPAAAEEK